jgi:hypothetical protein
LGYYAAVKLRDQYGGTPEAESVFTRFVAQAGGDTFSTSEAGRIQRTVFGGVSGAGQGKGKDKGRGRGRGRAVSPDFPPPRRPRVVSGRRASLRARRYSGSER